MVIGRVSHHWDLFAPLICYTANPWLNKRHLLTVEAIHPFLEKKAKKTKKFNRADWLEFKAKIKGGRS